MANGEHADLAVVGLDNRPTCRNCHLHRPSPIIGRPGQCAWAPPPAVARLYAMLQAEPATHIDYREQFNELPDALKTGACGEWKRKVDA